MKVDLVKNFLDKQLQNNVGEKSLATQKLKSNGIKGKQNQIKEFAPSNLDESLVNQAKKVRQFLQNQIKNNSNNKINQSGGKIDLIV